MRIDKYLWAIRLFKTRTLATEACRAGRVKLHNTALKASHEVKPGEEISIQKGADKKLILVTGLLTNRVDAKLALTFYEDHSPLPDPDAAFSVFLTPVFRRDRGAGRPTKKDRREMNGLRDED